MPLRQLAEATKTNKQKARISHLKLHPVSSLMLLAFPVYIRLVVNRS